MQVWPPQRSSRRAIKDASMPAATRRIDLPERSGLGKAVCAALACEDGSGTATSKVEPLPGSLSSVIRPPMRLTMRSLMESPSPVPP